jgi:hypothetical protein
VTDLFSVGSTIIVNVVNNEKTRLGFAATRAGAAISGDYRRFVRCAFASSPLAFKFIVPLSGSECWTATAHGNQITGMY